MIIVNFFVGMMVQRMEMNEMLIGSGNTMSRIGHNPNRIE
jgi:hypothetical protein